MKNYIALILLGFFLVSCDLYKQDDYTEQFVVEAYLIADEDLPEIRLTTTGPIDQVFDINSRAVNDATIVIREFDENGELQWTEVYQNRALGYYDPTSANRLVLPRRKYDLEITTNSGDIIRASTVVPDTFSVVSLNATALPYQGPEQFELLLTPSYNPNRQTYYIFSTQTLDPENAEFTPFYANFADDREDFYIVSSGILNESSTNGGGSGLIELTYPWIGVAFFGPNRITTSAVDDNIYDFVRSASVQLGGGTQSPGEIENIISNIEGAIGIFGSYARISTDVEIQKN
jgi:hypothetical protein